MSLPDVLAGPMLRRVERGRVCVWLATSQPGPVTVEVVRLAAEGRADLDDRAAPDRLAGLGSAEATTVRLGARLWVHLAEVAPDADAFPGDVLLGYDVVLRGADGRERRLADLGLLDGPDGLAYPGLPLPSFAVRQDEPALRLLHGSCRLLHGLGDDALRAADDLLADRALDPARRPCALLLTGDQIYGDDVSGPLIGPLRRLADEICGGDDATSVPGLPDLSELPVYGRRHLASERAAFTSPNAENHLFSFGEYAAMYLLAWNPEVWPASFPSAHEALSATSIRQRRTWRQECTGLERTRAGLAEVRRVLANVPTYTTFDDHDVTDDWNITALWRERVRERPTGRRVVANALAAFWAFQGWGNDPGAHPAVLRDTIVDHLAGEGDPDVYDRLLWDHDRWSYVAPTSPPTLVLDTRTQRHFDTPEGAARLVDDDERRRLVERCRDVGHRPGDMLVLVSPVPVYGMELQERRQKALVKQLGPYRIDFEQWHSSLAGVFDLQEMLAVDLGLDRCLVLSGDVHYGLSVRARFAVGDRRVEVAQLISSSLQHGGAASKWALDAVGSMVSVRHDRVGWRTSPPAEGARKRDRLVSRPADTDAWDDDTPVLIAPRRARRSGITKAPEFRESRRYVRPRTHRASVVVGDNNIGLVTLEGDTVTHELLTRRADETRIHPATLDLG